MPSDNPPVSEPTLVKKEQPTEHVGADLETILEIANRLIQDELVPGSVKDGMRRVVSGVEDARR